MDIGLQGHVACITGAAGDIGSAVARVFAAEGVHLALLDKNGPGLAALARPLRASGAIVSTAVVDLSQQDEVTAGVAEVLRPHDGRIDVLINNVGICPAFPLEYLLDPRSLPAWRTVYESNFYGYLLTIMSVLPIMRAQRSGVIINNASDLARQPVPEMLHYSTAKAAVLHLSQGLAPLLGTFNVRVVAVAPGPTRTAIWTREGGLIDMYAEKYHLPPAEAIQQELCRRGMALPRLAEPDEIAYAMVYLASPLAASVTRCTFDINSGSHQGY
jgi:NAD(P)-dependent dehydrogenase (short-subunit alcohol dehydrogenase family)